MLVDFDVREQGDGLFLSLMMSLFITITQLFATQNMNWFIIVMFL